MWSAWIDLCTACPFKVTGVASEVGDDKVFDQDDNALIVLWREGRALIGPASKQIVAKELIELITSRIKT